ncbi:MAG: hypothetical protein SVR81_09190 [Chloroflexota bacterium]|nr:hypothetical protein [Chloroflexota bacterium]
MKTKNLIFLTLILLTLSACAPAVVTETIPTTAITTEVPTMGPTETETASPTETGIATETETPTEVMSLEATADLAVTALAEKDLAALADLVHPEMGVRFSPYAYVEEEQLVFMADQLPGLLGSDEVYHWGVYDGSGQPIDLTFSEYYDQFVYSLDLNNADETAVNERLGQGNSLNNIDEFYPDSSFVEYYINGIDPQYDGMDWQSLRLVFKQESDRWLLIGIVHDEWTI